ncbi:thermonuclease family protein [Aquincola sp. S2]|uniref:Thermonuclease family protein n=1 Tax=Pseudaquabacterium terrae TaxID=2732868 RepID=A0ABX2ES61_9BURK|nr:thermonuclease family protein [Aquabacterium terrae]NRF71384.1 thermonuclease family protein [Aquabacterium terrae]
MHPAVTFGAALAALAVATAACARSDGETSAKRATNEAPSAIAGTVIHVTDGDTLVMRERGGASFVVRLTDIDAPETSHGANRPGQPFSSKATTHLKDLALGLAADAECYGRDVRQGNDGTERVRHICRVRAAGKDLSLAMVDVGLAMANRQNKRYVRDKTVYAHEDQAKRQEVGLWAQPEPIAPWVWRRMCWQHKFCEAADRAP